MTLLSQTECCALLGIDPKTLRQWLQHAQLSFVSHPVDARRKCLSAEQVQYLATLHARPLPALPLSSSPVEERSHPVAPLPLSPGANQELIEKITCLEHSVAALQDQVAHLTLALLQERTLRDEQRMVALEAILVQIVGAGAAVLPQTVVPSPEAPDPLSPQRLLPIEQRARTRAQVSALIEYGAQGRYLAVCPREGALPLIPDSLSVV